MKIEGLNDSLLPLYPETKEENEERGSSFQNFLNNTIKQISALENKATELSYKLATNQPDVELHDVMIASQEADVAFRLTLHLRNKVLEAYREVMRMTV